MLQISFLGKTRIIQDGTDITARFGGKAIALLCILFLHYDQSVPRERLLGYLWPDSEENAARYNLRYNLWMIRKNIKQDRNGQELLSVSRSSCEVNDRYEYTCDIVDIDRLHRSDSLCMEKLIEIPHTLEGDFMEGYYFKNCSELNEMILIGRSRMEGIRISLLMQLAGYYEENERFQKCADLLERLNRMEPYDEEIALRIMNVYEKQEKISAAILFYNSFQDRLLTVLGVRPGRALEEKYRGLKYAVRQQRVKQCPADVGESVVEGEASVDGCSAEYVSTTESQATKLTEADMADTTRNGNRPTLIIRPDCVRSVEWFAMADAIAQIAECLGSQLKEIAPAWALAQISRICPELSAMSSLPGEDCLLKNDETMLPVSITRSCMTLMEELAGRYHLKLRCDSERMDQTSQEIFMLLAKHGTVDMI
ncbi:AfsR/SARP family transcriptional regulator [Hornefia butyriciproducens]|uniref:AfsR/SARP family transcriptional regulator n=1 Tax=Hornefia butyriciproducens TaxID=2652293 RepID=UPI002A91D014|nr:BTAD domain-containing putative transcriptional regulator [Hornefia butyriciproducens]MCI7412554.1 hypothetical protein [Clostridiales bacterium]MDY5462083.1 BTAD domain-containing putative transcriptional regulator [Hornefia butyriciproducens]MDY6212749.1 BTAD domain-containing putative transcriptional regulator [Hornefia butyriciproducens]